MFTGVSDYDRPSLCYLPTSTTTCRSGYSYRVVLGKHSVSTSEFGEVTPPLSLAVWHSYWNPSMPANGYDIAMFKIASPVALSSKVRLACLPSANQILPNNYPCYATGWGSLDTSGPFPSALQQASLPVVDYATCSQPSWWGSSLRSSVICAGGSTRSACYVRTERNASQPASIAHENSCQQNVSFKSSFSQQ
ncbi:chymotrypsin-like elastase family member 2A [Petromyzon marinus]|uniref:chymotrypsin-like elastase family member 2A n=1 Tax=Petromyzon marinus TaxID=7757 RepID=UPI003F71E17A